MVGYCAPPTAFALSADFQQQDFALFTKFLDGTVSLALYYSAPKDDMFGPTSAYAWIMCWAHCISPPPPSPHFSFHPRAEDISAHRLCNRPPSNKP